MLTRKGLLMGGQTIRALYGFPSPENRNEFEPKTASKECW